MPKQTCMAWALQDKNHKYQSDPRYPGTINVWQMQDWPFHMAAAAPSKKMRVIAGTLDMTQPMISTSKRATAPYAVPEDAFEAHFVTYQAGRR